MKHVAKKNRIGVYAGTFDPVHVGHMTFALQAITAGHLDEVIFLPERTPRRKHPTEHYAHRVAMLTRATAPYPRMSVLELADKQFTTQRTWPQLRSIFSSADLALIVGSDVLTYMPSWPRLGSLLKDSDLIVGARAADEPAVIRAFIASWTHSPKDLHIVQSYAPHVSSTAIRQALANRLHIDGLLASVHAYSNANWLYISIKQAVEEKA